MARVVCQVLPRKTQWTLLWSEGPATFPPYVLEGAALTELHRLAEKAHQQLAILGTGDAAALAGAAYLLAQAGHEIYRLLFQFDQQGEVPGREVHGWLQGLTREAKVEQLTILGDPFTIPWTAIYDRLPNADSFAGGEAEAEGWKGFWGRRFPVLGGRRVQSLRGRQLPNKLVGVAAIDPVLLASLPPQEQQRLNDFIAALEWTVVESAVNLAGIFQTKAVDILYVFGRADGAAMRLGDDRLTAESLQAIVGAESDAEEPAETLLFVNACSDNAGDKGVSASVGLSAFQRFNSVGLIGTLQPVAAPLANRCGLEFLADIVGNGKTVGAALESLRRRQPSAGLLYFASCPDDLRIGRETDAESDREPLPLPDRPYQPLAPLNEDTAALLVGRELDTARVASLLDEDGASLVLVHGATGVGKASLLRAGVVPYLETHAVGYQLLRQRAEEEQETDERDYPVMAIRASSDLEGQLAVALLEFCSQPYAFTTPAGNTVTVDLPAILGNGVRGTQGDTGTSITADHERIATGAAPDGTGQQATHAADLLPTAEDLRIALRHQPHLLGYLLAAITAPLPFELVLLVEQGEELFSLTTSDDNAGEGEAALLMLRAALARQPRAKFVVALRTEYLGRYLDPLLQTAEDHGFVRAFLVRELTEEDLVDVILQPTSEEPLPGTDEVPQEKYGFQFEQGLAEHIANEALRGGNSYHSSALAVVHVICGQLSDRARRRDDKVVRTSDLKAIGGVSNGLNNYVANLVNVTAAGSDRKALNNLLGKMFIRQPDGSLTRALVSEEDLARLWTGTSPMGTVLQKATHDDLRLLEMNYLNVDGNEGDFVSLGHDVLAPVVAQRGEEEVKRAHGWAKMSDVLWITVPIIVLLGVVSAVLFRTSRLTQPAEVKDEIKTAITEAQMRIASMRWPRYVGQLQSANQAIQVGDLPRARQALMSLKPVPRANEEEMDLRGFEWHYLWHQMHQDQATLVGHEGTVRAIALTDDGFTMATSAEDGPVRIADALTGRELASFDHDSKKAALSLAFAPHSGLVAAGYEDGSIVFWNTWRGELAFSDAALVGSLAPTIGGVVPPIGQLGARGLPPKAADLKPAKNETPVVALAFIRDGKNLTLAATGRDGSVKLWDLSSDAPKLSATLDKHEGGALAVAYAEKAKLLASAGADHKVHIQSIAKDAKKKTKQTLDIPGLEIASVAWTGDGKTLAVAGTLINHGLDTGVVKLYDAATGKETKTLDVAAPVFAVGFTPDGKMLVTAGKDNNVRFWNVATGQEQRALRGHLGWIRSLAIARHGPMVASGSYDTTAKVWKLPEESAKRDRLTVSSQPVLAIGFSTDDQWLATGSGDGKVKLWNAVTGQELKTLAGHDKPVQALAWSNDGKWLVTGDEGGQLKLWDVDPTSKTYGTELDAVKEAHKGAVTCLQWPPETNKFASGSADSDAKVWKVEAGKFGKEPVVIATGSPVSCLTYFSDFLATGHTDGKLRMWHGDGGKPLPVKRGRQPVMSGHQGPVTGIALVVLGGGSDAKRPWLITSSTDQTIRAWNVLETEEDEAARGHGGAMTCMAAGRTDKDNHTIVTGSLDTKLKLWEPRLAAMQERWAFSPEVGVPRALALSSDTRLLAVAGQDGSVRLYRAGKAEPKGK